MTWYMAVTNDEYELPVMQCASPYELADALGVHYSTIYHGIKRGDRATSMAKYRFYKIEEEDVDK